MKREGSAIVLVLIFYCASLLCPLDELALKNIHAFIQNFKRPFTVIECYGAHGTPQLLPYVDHGRDMTLVLLPMELQVFNLSLYSGYHNVVVLNPPQVNIGMLNALAQCEQPDLVVVHDMPEKCKPLLEHYVRQFLRLGDYCMFDFDAIDDECLNHSICDHRVVSIMHHEHDTGALVLFKTGKEGLIKARWTAKIKRRNPEKVRYHVQADFQRKVITKDIDFHLVESVWERGINLITFVMLHGIYPTDVMMLKQFRLLKSISHNDLVMGNLLIQGRRLVPIDFNDKRRNIRSDVCVDALLKVFELHALRMQSPENFMNEYKKLIKPKRHRYAN